MERLQFVDEMKQVDEDERSITHFITAEVEDRSGDIVRSKGMDDANFKKNPVVMFGHDYRTFPIGKNLWLKTTTRNGVKGILAKTQFADTPEGTTAFRLWKDGFLNAASIGFQSIEKEVRQSEDGGFAGYDFKRWELFEYSIVPVPANPAALRLAIENKEIPDTMVKAFEPSLVELKMKELETKNAELLSVSVDRGNELLTKNEEIEALKAQIQTLTQPKPKTVVEILPSDIANIVRREISRLQGKVQL
jgi:HK97 family phage prohead protease